MAVKDHGSASEQRKHETEMNMTYRPPFLIEGSDRPNISRPHGSAVESQGRFREQDGIIYVKVASDATPASDWPARLKRQGFYPESAVGTLLSDICRDEIHNPFKRTAGITAELAIIRGTDLAADYLNNPHLHYAARKLGFVQPFLEDACLLREFFSKPGLSEIGLSALMVMCAVPDGESFLTVLIVEDIWYQENDCHRELRRISAFAEQWPYMDWHAIRPDGLYRQTGFVFALPPGT